MANPNIVNVTSIYGKTTYFTPSGTTAVVLLTNAASSGKVLKVNQIVVANVDGTNAVDCTVSLYTNGSVANVWVSGSVSIRPTAGLLPNSVGGVIGKTDASASVEFALGRVTVANSVRAVWPGDLIGRPGGNLSSSFAESGLVPSAGQLLGSGATVSGLAYATSSQLKDITTFAGWSISAGVNTNTIWGIDPAINGGYPFLQALPVPPDDPAQAPAPILQQVPRQQDGTCDGIDDRAFEYDTGLTGGWTPSWAQWARGGEGGPVCGRTLVYRGGWTIAT